MNRRDLMVDVALAAWLVIGSVIYLRQFVAQCRAFLDGVFGS
jgi:hypothetical protein